MVSIAPIGVYIIQGVANVPLVWAAIHIISTDTIKAAPHSFSNEGDAFSCFSGLLVLSRSIMI